MTSVGEASHLQVRCPQALCRTAEFRHFVGSRRQRSEADGAGSTPAPPSSGWAPERVGSCAAQKCWRRLGEGGKSLQEWVAGGSFMLLPYEGHFSMALPRLTGGPRSALGSASAALQQDAQDWPRGGSHGARVHTRGKQNTFMYHQIFYLIWTFAKSVPSSV